MIHSKPLYMTSGPKLRTSRLTLVVVITCMLGAMSHAIAQPAAQRSRPWPENFVALKHQSMPYRLLIPQGYDPSKQYPLTLCFHGAGGRGDDNNARGSEAAIVLVSDAVQSAHPGFVLVPQCPRDRQWVNTPWGKGSYSMGNVAMSDEMTLALEILDAVVKEYSIDPQRIYVTGQSMGGFATWDVLMRRPGQFAAAVIHCGAGDPSRAATIKHVPIWNFHGANDKVVPVAGSREMIESLKAAGSAVKYDEMAGVGHECWRKAWATPGVIDWLFEQRRE